VSRYWPLLLFLAATWGASYLFIKVAVEGGIEPAPLMAARALVAALCLFGYLTWTMGATRAVASLRRSWRQWIVLGSVGAALPFWLVAWGEKHVDSGIAAIAQATVPIFTLILGARFLPHEPLGVGRAAGIGLGLVGVAALTGLDPELTAWTIAGTLAVVLASLAYSVGNVVGQRSVSGTPGPVLATGSMLTAGIVLSVPGVLQFPTQMPDTDALLSVLALTVLGTAVAQLVLYRMLRLFGSRRVSLVTYLMPALALVYGAILLDEPLQVGALAGLALILLGVALGSGALTASRREAEEAAAAPVP
jgi:drug/metabolite transporter (DMT)-like permease